MKRENIEALLNRTGYTLKGIPTDFGDETLMKIRRYVLRKGVTTEEEIAHLTCVCNRLVAALEATFKLYEPDDYGMAFEDACCSDEEGTVYSEELVPEEVMAMIDFSEFD